MTSATPVETSTTRRLTPTASQVLHALSEHVGREHGITGNDLAYRLRIRMRLLRNVISELRLYGIAVCGTPEAGYYIAATAEELEQTCQFLRARALHSLTLEARLRKLPLPDLIGQLHLRT